MPTGGVCTLGLVHDTPPFGPGDLSPLIIATSNLHKVISSTEVILEHLELKRGPEATGPTYTAIVNQAGTGSGGAVAPNTSVLIRKELSDISAKFSGRMYWPGPNEEDVDQAGALSGAYVSAVQTALNAFYTALRAALMSPCVFNSEPIGTLSTVVSKLSLQSHVATQRRRLRR